MEFIVSIRLETASIRFAVSVPHTRDASPGQGAATACGKGVLRPRPYRSADELKHQAERSGRSSDESDSREARRLELGYIIIGHFIFLCFPAYTMRHNWKGCIGGQTIEILDYSDVHRLLLAMLLIGARETQKAKTRKDGDAIPVLPHSCPNNQSFLSA